MLNGKTKLGDQELDKINGGFSGGATFMFDCPLCGQTLYTDNYAPRSIVNCSCNHSFTITGAGRRKVSLKDNSTGISYSSDASESG